MFKSKMTKLKKTLCVALSVVLCTFTMSLPAFAKSADTNVKAITPASASIPEYSFDMSNGTTSLQYRVFIDETKTYQISAGLISAPSSVSISVDGWNAYASKTFTTYTSVSPISVTLYANHYYKITITSVSGSPSGVVGIY